MTEGFPLPAAARGIRLANENRYSTPYANSTSKRLSRKGKTQRIELQNTLGWKVVPFDAARDLTTYKHHAIEEYLTDYGPADYVLVSNGACWPPFESE